MRGTAKTLTFALAAILVAGVPGLAAQGLASYEPVATRNHPFPLTIESIMRGPEHVGQAPAGVAWSDDGEWVYFRWLPGGHEWHADRELYRVAASGGEPEELSDEEADALGPVLSSGVVSADGRWRAVSSGGDLYVIDRATGRSRQLTHTSDNEGGPTFSADASEIFFRRDTNLYAFDLESGAIRQLTHIASGPEPRDPAEPEGHKAFLEQQQTELFEHVRVQETRRERREADSERRSEAEPEPLHLAQGERAFGLVPDPTATYVAVSASKPAEGERTDIPLWITDSGYTENTEMRTKVGDEQSASRLGIIELASGETTWLDLQADEPAEDAEGAQGEEGDKGDDATDPPFASFVEWNDAGTRGLVYTIDADFKTWRLYSVDPTTGETTLLDSLYDEAWVGGACSSRFGAGCLGWIPDEDRIWYVSEETGYAHMYTIAPDGSGKRALTSGNWEILAASVPAGWDHFLLRTNELSPHDQHPWTLSFDGSEKVQLLEGSGQFNVTPSPDGSRFAVIHSRANQPPELYLADVGEGAELERVTVSPTDEWAGFDWRQPEIIRFEARDGTMVPARIYRPSDFGVGSNGAGVVFVHGAGYLQNVHNWWSNYFREYMFHHFLAAQGYTVLDIDYRGSAGYGRDWRTAIYRHMGGWDLSDQVDGAAYLVAEEGVDADRLGIYGGSYGGFITLMALFTEPEVFEAGAALRSVTDWAHYNHGYTARILNLPQDDEEAYRQSSPIYFAEGLEGHLLMAHGMYDTNVHFSDVVRLAQRLIELGKENWEMAVYPVENHGFAEPASWTDEYRRIYELFERVIGSGSAAASQGAGG
ncbi:MAG: S9 family peptidase [Gemmatimonadota bacterium]|nr:S9 family peptidase [Gemmatimonadota bacterium]